MKGYFILLSLGFLLFIDFFPLVFVHVFPVVRDDSVVSIGAGACGCVLRHQVVIHHELHVLLSGLLLLLPLVRVFLEFLIDLHSQSSQWEPGLGLLGP